MPNRNKVFGILIDTRQRRRRLVVASYVFLLLLVAGCLYAAISGDALVFMSYPIYAVFALNFFALGGYTNPARGLVKAFPNKPPRQETVQSTLLKLELENRTGIPFVASPSDESWKNDERELARRGQAHYLAYQAITISLMVLLLLATFLNKQPFHPIAWMPPALLRILIYATALIAALLSLTLPQAIILWTDPDLPPDSE